MEINPILIVDDLVETDSAYESTRDENPQNDNQFDVQDIQGG